MDQSIRNKLRNVVTQCRKLLEEAVTQVLQGQFGISSSGKKDAVHVEDESSLKLSAEDQGCRQDLVAHMGHIQALGYKAKDALAQLVREIAFTHLNRLCAYKMMEARGVWIGGKPFREAVSRGMKSQGFQFYLAADDHKEDKKLFDTGHQDVAYRHFLGWLGGLLSEEIGVLFSPTDPANRLFPPQRVLDEVLALLNSDDLKEIWAEDETVGWVYQYFTPKELRDQVRKESAAPRNSYELAFRNQFFTPRYVVEFLTDNTLGRIWCEMRQGNTTLKDRCRYMVRRPDEVFLSAMSAEGHEHFAEGCGAIAKLLQASDETSFPACTADDDDGVQRMIDLSHCVNAYERNGMEKFRCWQEPESRVPHGPVESFTTQELLDYLFMTCRADRHGGDGTVYRERWFVDVANEVRRRAISAHAEDATQEQLLKAPQFVPFRAKKDPREIRILDPACGSGHFLLYCFDLLQTIYEEAYEDEELGPKLKEDYSTLEALQRDVPRLILAHNLHGIDIDLRATQIAALALWLRCQRAYRQMGVKQDRPRITKSNIVCAEPMPGEKEMLREFLSDLQPKLLGHLVEVVFDKMTLAGESGSLLKIEEEIRETIGEAKKQWTAETVKATDRKGRTLLFTQAEMDRTAKKGPQQTFDFDVSEINDVAFFEHAEANVVQALRSYAEKAQNGQRLQRRLFSEDAVRGFAFVDLCHKRFDVVLMNPPFGLISSGGKEYIFSKYPVTKNDLLAAFVEVALDRLLDDGILGAITSRTGFYLATFQAWREEVVLRESSPVVFADLGSGVLDSAMVETAAFCLRKPSRAELTTVFFRLLHDSCKDAALLKKICDVKQGHSPDCVFLASSSSLRAIPGVPFAYWVSNRIRRLYHEYPSFESEAESRTTRCGLGTTDNFRFLRTHWEVRLSERERDWVTYYDGGVFSPVYDEFPLVVRWTNDGEEVKRFIETKFGSASRNVRGEDFYFRPGFVFPRRTKGLSPKVMAGGIFSNAGQAGFVPPGDLLPTVGLLASSACTYLVSLSQGRTGDAAQFEVGLIKRLPWPLPIRDFDAASLAKHVRTICDLKRELASVRETSLLFSCPALVWHQPQSLSEGIEAIQARMDECGRDIQSHLNEIDNIAFAIFGFTDEDVRQVKDYFGRECSEAQSEEVHSASDEEPVSDLLKLEGRDHVASLVSYLVGCVAGRWDVRFATKERLPPNFPDPLSNNPFNPVGMIESSSVQPTADHLLRVDQDGILVDDLDHQDDVVRRVRCVLELIWKDRADAIEKEACEILGVKEIRDYFRKPGKGGFWDDHVSRYSKSRRKAPIYWLLQSSKKNYGLWLYYHRLDKDILFKARQNYVDPKIRLEQTRLDSMRAQKIALGADAKGAKRIDKDIERQEILLAELKDFAEKLERAAKLNFGNPEKLNSDVVYAPDLNDGVVLNIAPLWELVPWKEAKNYWEELLEGKYEWSSMGKLLRKKGLVK